MRDGQRQSRCLRGFCLSVFSRRAVRPSSGPRLAAALPALWFAVWSLAVRGVERFPPPDFESGYTLPTPFHPEARAEWFGILDGAVLVLALLIAGWLALRRRSRTGIAWLAVGGLLYFGFYRGGCVCPIGAVQNVALAFADPGYALSGGILLFFLLPLLMSLWMGRIFCSGVCPLGAIQDTVLIKPLRVPGWLAGTLGLVPWLYLGLAILYAVTDAGFVICRFDPFVRVFRMSGAMGMLVFAGAALSLCAVVGRPYCRFFCPYGILLGIGARVSRHRVSVTPDRCINCGLCRDACPFDAIRPPTQGRQKNRFSGRGIAGIGLVLVLAGVGVGWVAGPLLARVHPRVALAAQLRAEEAGAAEAVLETDTFREEDGRASELYREAAVRVRQYRLGGGLVGAGMGIVATLSLLPLLRPRKREEYEIDAAACVACGRCFSYCPRDGACRFDGPDLLPDGQEDADGT